MPLFLSYVQCWFRRVGRDGPREELSLGAVSTLCVLLLAAVGLGTEREVQAQEQLRLQTDTSAVDSSRYEPDPVLVDSLSSSEGRAVDSETTPRASVVDTGRVSKYLPSRRRRSGRLFDHTSPFLGGRSSPSDRRSVALDSTEDHYVLTDDASGDGPMRLEADVYRRERYRSNIDDNWRTLVERRQQQRGDRGGLGVNMVVPGGRESAFSTIFGKPEVDLRLNGQADINAGFNYRQSDQQVAITGDASQIDPDFKQDLRLGITGTIGDKLQINVDWDTNNQFDYQNQVKLNYTGYEDEIIQSVEAGNVYLETPSRLISGGQSLFGLKSELQLGNLSLTTVASQQEGQSNTLSIEGGAETTEFDLQPTDYDEGTHYFLGYYFRNNWNRAHQNPTTLRTFDGFDKITDIEVWKLRTSQGPGESDIRKAAAVVDLGENSVLLEEADEYTDTVLPDSSRDQYGSADLAALRDGDVSVSTYVRSSGNLNRTLGSQDVVEGEFKRLEKGRDYRLDDRLGFLSLQQRLRSDEALAVAFRYRTNDGEVHTVGDFSSDQGGTSGGINADRLLLKLLRPTNPVSPNRDGSVDPAAWFLEMRNVYRLGGRGFESDNFELDIEYDPPGQSPTTTISEVAGQDPLLQVLGLDRIDQDGSRNPDNQFDFTPLTIDSEEGLIYFPYLEPFGEHILDVAEQNGNRGAGQPYAFQSLYDKKKSNAEQEDEDRNVYHMRGSYRGTSKEFYDLEAFAGLVEGSVEVTAGGQTLEEGTDYVVDYQGGTVTITNQSYLAAGRNIEISYEQNNLVSLQQKTLLGARADWNLRNDFSLGATVMRLSQKSPVDKFRIGEEPVKNTIWGVDGSMDLQPRWLTQAVDALPLIDTRAESQLSVSGEFAQLRPGHTTTEAFDRTVDAVEDSEQDDFASDERNGVSYVDDFEGFENTFSLREQLGAWQVSAAPDSTADAPGLNEDVPGATDDQQRTYWRGSFGWYQLNEKLRDRLEGSFVQRGDPEATRILGIDEVFNRDTRGEATSTLRTLDVYFDPWERGAYNYTPNLDDFFREPRKVWGGVTRRLPEGYTDFSVQNVEFVEFIVKVYPQNGEITDDARLFLDLGTISEDVVPNERLNTEDGLPLSDDGGQLGELSRFASGSQNQTLDIRGERTEDLGLDGLVSYTDGAYSGQVHERSFYDDFVEQADSLEGALGRLGLTPAQRQRLEAEIARTKRDPSADDYHYYENDRYFNNENYFPEEVTLQQRFSRYYAGHELNSFEAQNKLAEGVSIRRGLSRSPDTEDLDETGGNVNITNDYFQYAIPLDELDERAQSDQGPTDYVVSKVGEEEDWYKVRIPVRNFTRKVGNIEDFTRIQSLRMWTTGHKAPVTMRFASFELVGSQWRSSESVAQQPVENGTTLDSGDGELRVASINDEEDPDYEAPIGAIVSRNQTARGVQQRSREQSLLLNVDRLGAGQQRGIFKTFNQGLDLLKYSNLRMYTHVHGSSNTPQEKEEIRENLRLFVRIGGSETGDYYEYEQPLTPSNVPGTADAQSPWLQENEMNLVLSALNQLKTARDQSGQRTDTTFTSEDVDLPLDFAPSNTVLKIRGTPSLRDVNTVVIGVRHAGDPDESPRPPDLKDLELWVNELRVSGFDERKGWAANSNASVSLADLADVQGSFQRRTDGFGGLSSTLSERQQSDNTSWNLRADLHLDALLPEQQGWSLPVTMQVQSSHTAPRFDPHRGDVRVDEVAEQFNALPDSTIENNFADKYPGQSLDEVRRQLQDSVRTAAESFNLRRTLTADVSKQGSTSWWLRHTMDATSLSFSYFDREAHSPQRRLDDQWNWSGSFEYRLNFGRARTFNPLGFLPDVPVLGSLADVAFNYVPRSLSFTSNAERDVTTRRSRPTSQRRGTEIPDRVAHPYRERQDFTHRRGFGLQYDPFEFLNLSFDTNTRQSFNDVAARDRTNLLIRGERGVDDTILHGVNPDGFFDNPSSYLGELPPEADITPADRGRTIFVEERLRQRSEADVFHDLIFGDASPRTNQYNQRFSATLRLGLTDRQALNWIDLQDISYQSSFDWRNGSQGSLTGANVGNSVSIRTGVSLHPNRVWERFGFFNRLKEAQRQADQDDERRQPPAEAEEGDEGGDAEEDSNGEDSNEEDDKPTWDDLPLPDPVGIFRRLALTVLDINDLTVNYNGDRSSQSSNVGTLTNEAQDVNVDYTLLDAFRGQGPSVGYRFGLERSVDPRTKRVLRPELQVNDALTDRHQFEGRTSLNPSQALQVDLNWDVEWSRQTNVDFQQEVVDGESSGANERRTIRRREEDSGDNSTSVWAFGSYGSLFEAQRDRLRRESGSGSEPIPAAGDVALTNTSVSSDFRDAFLTGGGSLGTNELIPFPMPGWDVRYSGLSDWPLLNRVVQSASLNHSYHAEYQSRFSSIESAGEETSFTVDGQTLRYLRPDVEVGSARISEQYQPLLGVDITWPGDLQTSVEWSRRTTTFLRTASRKVEEKTTSELSGRVAYSQRGLRIPVLGVGRLENQIRFSLTLSRSVNNERQFNLRKALEDAETTEQARQEDNVSILSETTRFRITPKLTYSLSNRVTADFQLEYEKFNGDSRQPSYTNINGGFNIRVSISEN